MIICDFCKETTNYDRENPMIKCDDKRNLHVCKKCVIQLYDMFQNQSEKNNKEEQSDSVISCDTCKHGLGQDCGQGCFGDGNISKWEESK